MKLVDSAAHVPLRVNTVKITGAERTHSEILQSFLDRSLHDCKTFREVQESCSKAHQVCLRLFQALSLHGSSFMFFSQELLSTGVFSKAEFRLNPGPDDKPNTTDVSVELSEYKPPRGKVMAVGGATGNNEAALVSGFLPQLRPSSHLSSSFSLLFSGVCD